LSISLLLEMAVSADPDRAAISWGGKELTAGGLSDLADGGAAMLPVLMFAAARAGVPVTPLNYRLSAAGLRELIDRLPQPPPTGW
jgi:hypothetical protein